MVRRVRPSFLSFARRAFASALAAVCVVGCSSTPKPERFTASEEARPNVLMSFTTDGCSSFPDGVPMIDETRWQQCCIVHDVAYWKGGTYAEREAADQALRSCVAAAQDQPLGDTMYMGVRVGGSPYLPTTWKWGYGWTQPRGYQELGPDEIRQVQTLRHELPAALRPLLNFSR